jgi:molybdopterin-guanine dinucleotide biosynthesis protein A
MTGDAAVAGIVLAGGRSARFGRDKLRETYRGRPLLQHAAARVAEVSDRVVIVLAPDVGEPPGLDGVEVRIARDAVADEGPLAGAAAGLQAADAELAVLVGGDMPTVEPAVLREMLRAARETGATAVALSDEGDARPLPCILRVEPAAEAIARLLTEGRRSLRDLLGSVRTVVVDEPTWTALDPERRTLLDVDVPGDLDRDVER